MLAVLGGLAEFERELIRARTGEGREPRRRAENGAKRKSRPAQARGDSSAVITARKRLRRWPLL
jgi:DNA invertase Pin-like site-specific DNA recombinase